MPKGVIIIIFIPDPLGYVSLEPINTSNFLSSRHNIFRGLYIFRCLYFQANRVHTVKLALEKNALNPIYNQNSPCESAKPPNRLDIF